MRTRRLGVLFFLQFTQYIFNAQWLEIKKYANDHGVSIMGDMPLYVSKELLSDSRAKIIAKLAKTATR
jgi:4-alpha-glucanotransferase